MLFNPELLADKSKQHFLVIERFSGMEPTASYAQQAQSLRRSMDAVEYMEKAFANGIVSMMHKAASFPSQISIVSCDTNQELSDFIKLNVAHTRLAPEDRQVIPLSDWDEGRETFATLIHQVSTYADTESLAAADGTVRDFASVRSGKTVD